MRRHSWYIHTMKTISDTLRKAVAGCGLSDNKLSELSGVNRLSLGRFMRGSQLLRMEQAEMLAAFFGLELKPAKRGGKKPKG